MSDDADHSPLVRPIRIDEIVDGANKEIATTAAERAAIKDLLDLQALKSLTFAYRLSRGAGGRLALSGRLKAELTQTCVITLEPVESALDVPVDVEFWPASLIARLDSAGEEPADHGRLDWPEPIEDGRIVLGPLIYETLATALDPYPRREGASFQWSQGSALEQAEAGQSGPFAALAKLKRP